MISILLLYFLFSLFLTFTVNGQTLSVGPEEKYQTIQEAIDAAQPNDIILVSCGIYNETIQLLKPLHLYGEEGCTILTHPFDNDIIRVSADNCTISGFTIMNCVNKSYSGLFLLSDGNHVFNNKFINNSGWGIYLYHCKQNNISNNSFTHDGICMVGSQDEWESMSVKGNMVLGKPIIWLKNQRFKNINDTIYGQLVLVNSTDCHITNITVSGTDQGIVLAYSEKCMIRDSTISKCRFGIRLQYSCCNMLINNTIINDEYGLYITHSDKNQILENILKENTEFGCYFCCNSKENIISKNRFINNTQTAYDYFDNLWSNHSIGNYYSDYFGEDENNDGIGDSPYEIPPDFGENIDGYPIVDFSKLNNKSTTGTPGFLLIGILLSVLFVLFSIKRK